MRRRAWLVLTAVLLLSTSRIWAHGGGDLVITQRPLGNYTVSVWLNPSTPSANQRIHITVGISDVAQAAVLDAQVEIAIQQGEATRQTASATTEQSVNRLFYEADLAALPEGAYTAVVTITGADGQGALDFPVEVTAVSYVKPILQGVAIAAVLAVGLAYWRWNNGKTAVTPRRPNRGRTASNKPR